MLKIRIAKIIPISIINNIFLTFPMLYKLNSINFESYADEESLSELKGGIIKTREIPGEIIECGCARCGTTCILANFLKNNKIDKKIYALDSFTGFEPEELKKEQKAGLTNATTKSFTYSSLDYVLNKIKKLEILEFVIPLKGFFQDTLPVLDKTFSLGFLDCDLEDSMSFATKNIWKKLSPGGILFFDDYASSEYKGAKVAIDKFVIDYQNEIKEHGFSGRLYHITKK